MHIPSKNATFSFSLFPNIIEVIEVPPKTRKERISQNPKPFELKPSFLSRKMASTLLLAVVFVFDLIAFALAIAAEQRRTSASLAQNDTTSYCVYNSDISTGLGIGSLIFLSASQLSIMFASRCLCFGKALMPGRSRRCAIFLFISSWVSFIIAGSCLLAGSVKNAYHTKYSTLISDEPPSCEVMRKGVFGAGAVFIVLTGLLSEFFYVSYTKVDGRHVANFSDSGIRMGAFN